MLRPWWPPVTAATARDLTVAGPAAGPASVCRRPAIASPPRRAPGGLRCCERAAGRLVGRNAHVRVRRQAPAVVAHRDPAGLVRGVRALLPRARATPPQPVCERRQGRVHARAAGGHREAAWVSTSRCSSAYGEFMKGIVAGRDVVVGSTPYPCDAPVPRHLLRQRPRQVTDELKASASCRRSSSRSAARSSTWSLGVDHRVVRRRPDAARIGDRLHGEPAACSSPRSPTTSSPAGLDLPDPAVRRLPQDRLLPDHRGPAQDLQRAAAAVAGARHRHAPRPTRGSPAARWSRRSATTTSAPPRPRASTAAGSLLQARPARGDRAHRDHLRPRLRRPAGRHDLHRVHLRHRRHRPLGPPGLSRARSTCR